jgi:hypothetical protein
MDFRTLIRNYLIAKSITLQDFASTIGLSYSQAYALVYLDSKISLEDITGISQAYPELKNENSAAPKPSIKTIVEKNLLDYKGLLEHQKEDISISLNSMEKNPEPDRSKRTFRGRVCCPPGQTQQHQDGSKIRAQRRTQSLGNTAPRSIFSPGTGLLK